MKTYVISILFFVFVLGIMGVEAGTQQWDFGNLAQEKEWKVANGKWKVKGGIYQETSGAEKAMHTLVGDTKWDNYTVEAKIRLDEGKWAGLIFRAQNEFEYYVFYLNVPSNETEFWRHKKGGGFDARDRLPQQRIPAAGGVKIKNGEWYKVKAVIEGTKYTLYIDNKKQGEVSDKVYDKSGKIGVWCWETKASFDDVKITGGNVKSLAVDSQSKLASVWGELKRE